MNSFSIGDRKIGAGDPPLIVAEMSGNHNQSLERALEIVDAAAQAGAHAMKLQTYTADTMTLNVNSREFRIEDPKSLWNGRSLYELYEEAHTPWEWHKPIADRCREHGMMFFSTPFDSTAVDFLESLKVPCYKVASFEATDLPLIKRIAATGKPVIMSTGMATEQEIKEAVDTARSAGCRDLVILKCTSTYPASPANTNIITIPDMRERFQTMVGLSDHTMGIGVAVASVALGAVLIEKHFTLRRADGGVDSAFSMEPHEMKALVEETKRAWESLGKVNYGPTEREKPSLQFRRSIFVAKDMKKGEAFTEETIRIVRPGHGLAPKHFSNILGKKAGKDLKIGTPLSWELVQA